MLKSIKYDTSGFWETFIYNNLSFNYHCIICFTLQSFDHKTKHLYILLSINLYIYLYIYLCLNVPFQKISLIISNVRLNHIYFKDAKQT